jgi:hypothetical protein
VALVVETVEMALAQFLGQMERLTRVSLVEVTLET